MELQVTPVSKDKWRIRAERGQAGHSAVGEVVVIQSTAPTAASAPHAALAGGRAWLALAEAREAAQDTEGGLAAARAGLAEVGDTYHSESQNIKDDTALNLALGEDLLERGRAPEALHALLVTLESRLEMYVRLHADSVAAEA